VARVISVNVGTPQQLSVRRGRPMMSAIVKAPVAGRVRVEGINVVGDAQADMRVHGGPNKAVYAYAREDSDWWQERLGRDIPDAMFGENLTTEGVDVTNALIGERWRIGTAEFEVCQPRLPCSKLGLRFGDLKMVKAFGEASRPGANLRIITEGEIGAGDELEITHRPEHDITVALVSDAILLDETLLEQALSAPELAEDLADAMRQHAA
jgi:MOSC domain-containing protein YiiM